MQSTEVCLENFTWHHDGLADSFVGFRSCSRILAAQNFTMPAMSPTMTEGNIASWKVKEGKPSVTGHRLNI